MPDPQKSEVRQDEPQQNRAEMLCRDCERFMRSELSPSIGWCDEQRQLVTLDMICPWFRRSA